MKVPFTNKLLRKNFFIFINTLVTGLSLVLTVVNFEQKTKIELSICVAIGSVILFFILWLYANKKSTTKLVINETNIIIKSGDIFSQNGIKVIAFNEYFDTRVDNKIIAETSLNGIFIKRYKGGSEAIDKEIELDTTLNEEKNIVQKNVDRKQGGKTTKYKLGSICRVHDDYFLLALTHFDNDNKAYLSFEDYISCLMRMWNELNKYYAGKPISITLLGSGITRFNGNVFSHQDILEFIIMTYKVSKIKLTSTLTIVIYPYDLNNIQLYDI
ncbi:MAG: hypothetical protein IIT88_03180 [Acetobacter sp.]|nr:hypothetical protein [Acetobacter sp.]